METGFDTKNGRYGAVQKEKLSRKLVESQKEHIQLHIRWWIQVPIFLLIYVNFFRFHINRNHKQVSAAFSKACRRHFNTHKIITTSN